MNGGTERVGEEGLTERQEPRGMGEDSHSLGGKLHWEQARQSGA